MFGFYLMTENIKDTSMEIITINKESHRISIKDLMKIKT